MIFTKANDNSTASQRETRARQRAAHLGLTLRKSRIRDTDKLGYGGFMIVDAVYDVAIAGSWPYQYAMSLDEVEDFLSV